MKAIDVELVVALAAAGLVLIACALWSWWRHRRDMRAAGVQVWPPPNTKVIPKEPKQNVSWRAQA